MRRGRLLAASAPLIVMCLACGVGGEDADPGSGPIAEAVTRAAEEAVDTGPPDPQRVCEQIVAAGVGTNCQRALPGGANARAAFKYEFDLVSLPGERGDVMSFATVEDYDATVRMYADLAMYAGPHRYGNREALIFVQMNEGASLDVGDRVRAIIEAL